MSKNLKQKPHSPVLDDEILFRRVIPNRNQYCYVDGNLVISASAFEDDKMQPSVDRAVLCNNNPKHTLGLSEKNGVISLIAENIRAEKLTIDLNNIYSIDIIPKPSKNLAHALIISKPPHKDKSHFMKLKERLAMLANLNGWTIKPKEIL